MSVQTESHRLIERLMIAANEQVASFLDEHRIPTLYRVHERPDGPAAERLVEQLESLGVPTPPVPGGALTQQQAAEVVAEASSLVSDWVARTGHGARALTSLVLRSLKQAYYDSVNRGHAGLASPRYCHFTSPIRRYPDLICHRGLLSAVAGEPAPDASWVASAGPWTSTRERQAMTIERDADDVARCFLLERERFGAGDREAVFEGEVVGLIGAGAFVAFGDGTAVSRGCCRCGGCGATGGSSTSRERFWSARGRAAPSGSGTRCRCGSDGSTRRGVGWICSPSTQRRSEDRYGQG